MKKKMLSLLLSAVMLATGAVSAGAAEAGETSLPELQDISVGEQATVLEKQDDKTLLVQTDTYDKLVLHCSNTIILNTQTGIPSQLTYISAGDTIYVYRDDAVMVSEPPQTGAQAILVNLDEAHAPASLITAEDVAKNEDGSLTIRAAGGGLELTVLKNASFSAFQTKNIVASDDIHIGTRFFAWYDTVALSYPAQAVTDRIVILPQVNSSFDIVIEGDMVLPVKGRVENGIAVVPVRAVAETLGYQVGWDGSTKTVSLERDGISASFTIGTDEYSGDSRVNGKSFGMIPYVINGTSWAPAELLTNLGESATIYQGALYFGGLYWLDETV